MNDEETRESTENGGAATADIGFVDFVKIAVVFAEVVVSLV